MTSAEHSTPPGCARQEGVLPMYHGNKEGSQGGRAGPDRRADGETHRPRAQGSGRAARHVSGRPARGRGPPRLRGKGPVRAPDAGADRRIAPDLWPGPDRRGQPSPEGRAVTPAEILAGLESCTVAKFGHAEHVAAAWEALRLEPFDLAAARICRALERF